HPPLSSLPLPYTPLFRSSAASRGIFLQYYLDMMIGNAQLLGSIETGPEQLYGLDEKDVVIGIGFSRYSASTVNMMGFAKAQGAKIGRATRLNSSHVSTSY